MGHYTIRTNDDEDQAIKKAQEATGQASASKTFMRGLRANGTKTYAKEITNCYN